MSDHISNTSSSLDDCQRTLTAHLTSLATIPFCSLALPHRRFPVNSTAFHLPTATSFLLSGSTSHATAVAATIEQHALPASQHPSIIWTVRLATGRRPATLHKLQALADELEFFLNHGVPWSDLPEPQHTDIIWDAVDTLFLPLLATHHRRALLALLAHKSHVCALTHSALLLAARTPTHARVLALLAPFLELLAEFDASVVAPEHDEQVAAIVAVLVCAAELMCGEEFVAGMRELWGLVPRATGERLCRMDVGDAEAGYDAAADVTGLAARGGDAGPVVRLLEGLARWSQALGTVVAGALRVRVRARREVVINVEVVGEEDEEEEDEGRREGQVGAWWSTRSEHSELYVHPEVKLMLFYLTAPSHCRPLGGVIGSSSSHCLACQMFFQALEMHRGRDRRDWVYYLQRRWPDARMAVEAVRPDASWKIPTVEDVEEGGLTGEYVEAAVRNLVDSVGCTVGRWRREEESRGFTMLPLD